jgi:hypothetical protein
VDSKERRRSEEATKDGVEFKGSSMKKAREGPNLSQDGEAVAGIQPRQQK